MQVFTVFVFYNTYNNIIFKRYEVLSLFVFIRTIIYHLSKYIYLGVKYFLFKEEYYNTFPD